MARRRSLRSGKARVPPKSRTSPSTSIALLISISPGRACCCQVLPERIDSMLKAFHCSFLVLILMPSPVPGQVQASDSDPSGWTVELAKKEVSGLSERAMMGRTDSSSYFSAWLTRTSTGCKKPPSFRNRRHGGTVAPRGHDRLSPRIPWRSGKRGNEQALRA